MSYIQNSVKRANFRAWYAKNKKYRTGGKQTVLDNLNEIIKLYNENWSTEAIANKYNVDKTSIRRELIKQGIKLRSKKETAQARSGNKNKKWQGYEEITGTFFAALRCSAKRRGIKVLVSIKDIWDLFLKQERKCALSGEILTFGATVKDQCSGRTTASLDRIDSNRDYTIDNIQWVHKDLNIMKREIANNKFISWCKKVYLFQEKKSLISAL